MVFFKKYLGEALTVPVLSPKMLTINDFFFTLSDRTQADRVTLLLELYECYRKLYSKAEPLDEFIFWGDVILGDFNDVDKYLADPAQLFANVADLKNIQDNFSYLTDTQRKAIEGFISHFSNSSGRLTVRLDSDNPDVRAKFLMIWNILHKLYLDFNTALNGKGLAYEGMVYRQLADKVRSVPVVDVMSEEFPDCTSFVFVGLNALNECEKTVLRKMNEASLAEFCWDYCGRLIRDRHNRSSFFMERNIADFPPVPGVGCEKESPVPEINVISVPSAVGQCKRLPQILKDNWQDCAVVLPDERLLTSVLNVIPEHIKDINVTMGLPMGGSIFYTLMNDISSVQLHAVNRNGRWYFYHKHLWSLFSNELFRHALDDDSARIISNVKAHAAYYIPQEELSGTPLLDTVFRVVVSRPKEALPEQIQDFAEYQKSVICAVASCLTDNPKTALELEFAKEYYKCVNLLKHKELPVLPATYARLLSNLLMSVSVPFRGEPLKGLQIMGPLEMRALDFRNLIIISADEGIFPRRSVSSSFIPPELRKGFGLPTYEYQDAVWAYYFYRAISRAEKVWMMVDSRTEGLVSGEESRYIKQLEYHLGVKVNRYVVQFDKMNTSSLGEVSKSQEDIDRIREISLSATSLQNYLECPAKFYYGTVKRLRPEEEVAESLDYGMLGTVFHQVMCAIYFSDDAMRPDEPPCEGTGEILSRPYTVTAAHLKKWSSRDKEIREKVKSLIAAQLKVDQVVGRNIVIADVIVRYVIRTLERDIELLREKDMEAFMIHGLEVPVDGHFKGQNFKGFIDRLDSMGDDDLRVVDYKTGKVLKEDEEITDANADAIAEKIFAPDVSDRPKIALQFFIYDMLLRERKVVSGRNLNNSIYSTARIFKDSLTVLPVNERFYASMSARLEGLLNELYDPQIPFRRTEDVDKCSYCDFKNICGR